MRIDLIHVEYSALDGVRSRLLNLCNGLDNAGGHAVARAGGSVIAGAGQFAACLGEDVERFVGSWRLYLDAVSDDCSIVGSSVGRASIDFKAVDTAACLPSALGL